MALKIKVDKFKLSLNITTNSFSKDPYKEVIKILKLVILQISKGTLSSPIMDADGKNIGSFEFELNTTEEE